MKEAFSLDKKKEKAGQANRKEQKQRAKLERRREKRLYKEALKKEHRYGTNTVLGWDKLDNTAHLFPVIAGESMSNVYRIFVTLNEEIDKQLLQQALTAVLPKFDGFNVRLRQGYSGIILKKTGNPRRMYEKKVHIHAVISCRTETGVICFACLITKTGLIWKFSRADRRHGRDQFFERADISVSAYGASETGRRSGGYAVGRYFFKPGGQLFKKL